MKQYGNDNSIFIQKGKRLKLIGQFGKHINANKIFKNLIKANSAYAKVIFNPKTFEKLVEDHGDWDLKTNNKTIYGLAAQFDAKNNTTTKFDFNGKGMTAEGLGNFHYGVVGKAAGFTDHFLLWAAGQAQMNDDHSKPEWQRWSAPTNSGHDFNPPEMIAPYGDDPKDQTMIKDGIKYYTNNWDELNEPEEN